MRHHGSCADYAAACKRDAGQNRGVRADGNVVLYDGFEQGEIAIAADGVLVVAEGSVGADENVAADCDAAPELDAAFDGCAVAHACAAFDERVRADVAVAPDGCAFAHNGKLPHAGARADGVRFNVRKRMDEW